MTTDNLIAGLPVLLVGVMICVTPTLSQPTLPFGVRVPPERTDAAVIRQERHVYHWRTAVLATCSAMATTLLTTGSRWLIVVIVLLELAAGLSCFWLARERITAVKYAEGWYEGLKQIVAADTAWRTEPPRFPTRWLLPPIAALMATSIIGAARYPNLPDRLAVHFTTSGAPDRWADKSLWSAFSLVADQLFTTALVTGLLLLAYHSRPDGDAADVPGSTRRYRRFLDAMARALLALVALVNVSLLLAALQVWQVYTLSGIGAGLPILPTALGVLILVGTALRLGQAGHRLSGAADAPRPVAGINRDDDRYWKGGLIYINRDDAALLVGKRFGIGWTLNFGNPKAWLLFGAIVVAAMGLARAGR